MPLIEHPESHPIIGHRLLLLWLARVLHQGYPGLNSKTLLIASQVPAALFTTLAIGFWSAEFVGLKRAFLGQLFMLTFLLPTISYYNFYDIAIVGFYAATFLAVVRQRFWLTVPLISIATLNHENALLLVPAVASAAFLNLSIRKALSIAGAAFLGYASVRLALFHYLPMSTIGDLRFYSNAVWVANLAPSLLVGGAMLLFRWACALMGWTYAPPTLKRLAIIWPALIIVTVAFGQFTETRQFDADIPLCTALLLIYVRNSFRAAESLPSNRV